MDVQRTMVFILGQQAKVVEQQYRTDRRVDAIAKLVRTGMKMLIKLQEGQQALIEAQIRTEAKLERIDEQLARTDERLARTDEKLARTDEQLARSDKKFERLLAALIRQRTDGRRR